MSEPNGNGWRNRIVGHGEKAADQFQAHPRNWRQHPKAQRQALAASLNGVGWVDTVIENVTTGHLLDGHERIWQALDRGDNTPVPFTQVELSEDEENLVLATFDSITQMAMTDGEILEDLLSDLRVSDLVVAIPDLDALLHEVAARADVAYGEFVDAGDDPGADIDRADELREKWQTERGQVWEVPSVTTPGKAHRVMCGDSTSGEDVARLMDEETASMVFADPPFGISYTGHGASKDGRANKFDPIIGDNDPDAGWLKYCLLDDGGIYLKTHWDVLEFWKSALENVCQLKSLIVWDRCSHSAGDVMGGYATQSEIILFGTIGKHKINRFDTDIWKIARATVGAPENRTGHPFESPVDLPKRAIENSSQHAQLIFDPFLGSGTTAVAAEQTRRICCGMEISEAYTAVCLERLSGMGLNPRLVDDASV